MLADDIPASLKTWESLLQATCVIVARASDGHSALDAIHQFKPDVAVLDMAMPGLSGIDVARKALKEQPRIGIVLCTVMRDPELVRAAADMGVRGYVFKIDARRDLANTVAKVAAGGSALPKHDNE